jgi:hypothetical protein
LLFGAGWVGLVDGCFQQGLQPTPRHRAKRWRDVGGLPRLPVQQLSGG